MTTSDRNYRAPQPDQGKPSPCPYAKKSTSPCPVRDAALPLPPDPVTQLTTPRYRPRTNRKRVTSRTGTDQRRPRRTQLSTSRPTLLDSPVLLPGHNRPPVQRREALRHRHLPVQAAVRPLRRRLPGRDRRRSPPGLQPLRPPLHPRPEPQPPLPTRQERLAPPQLPARERAWSPGARSHGAQGRGGQARAREAARAGRGCGRDEGPGGGVEEGRRERAGDRGRYRKTEGAGQGKVTAGWRVADRVRQGIRSGRGGPLRVYSVCVVDGWSSLVDRRPLACSMGSTLVAIVSHR